MYLAIDLWDKRCWIAVEIEWISVPKDIVPRINLIKILKNYIFEYNASVIVVWLPYDLYNKDKKQLEKTNKFIAKLREIFPDIEIKTIDERYTSFEAENTLDLLQVRETTWKKDAISASLILETYLQTLETNK
jgi:putative Holliday junction resolvase